MNEVLGFVGPALRALDILRRVNKYFHNQLKTRWEDTTSFRMYRFLTEPLSAAEGADFHYALDWIRPHLGSEDDYSKLKAQVLASSGSMSFLM